MIVHSKTNLVVLTFEKYFPIIDWILNMKGDY